jgi:hypothetical protein
MAQFVMTGQKWAAWVPGRGQWLLATVTRCEGRAITLSCDERYGLAGDGDVKTDEDTMLENNNLFRFLES